MFYRNDYLQTANRNPGPMAVDDFTNELASNKFTFNTDTIREELVEMLDLLFQSVQTNKEDWIRAFDTTQKVAPSLNFSRPPTIRNGYTEAHAVSHVLEQTNVRELLVHNVEEVIFNQLLLQLARTGSIRKN